MQARGGGVEIFLPRCWLSWSTLSGHGLLNVSYCQTLHVIDAARKPDAPLPLDVHTERMLLHRPSWSDLLLLLLFTTTVCCTCCLRRTRYRCNGNGFFLAHTALVRAWCARADELWCSCKVVVLVVCVSLPATPFSSFSSKVISNLIAGRACMPSIAEHVLIASSLGTSGYLS